MGMSSTIKFVRPPNSFLICLSCRKPYENPVINVKCGHTFCLRCVEATGSSKNSESFVSCPEDGTECKTTELVVNRAIAAQVDDQDVYCQFGLKWSDEAKDFIRDPTGCNAVIKYGQLKQHEMVCDFAAVPCPNVGENGACGLHRRRSLQRHLDICCCIPCPNKNRGCTYVSSLAEVKKHAEKCASQTATTFDSAELVEKLLTMKTSLENRVSKLEEKVVQLEQTKVAQSSQIDALVAMVKQLTTKLDELQSVVSRGSTFVSPSRAVRVGPCSEDSVNNSPGHVTFHSRPSSAVFSEAANSSTRLESWSMPFQFKCIGTLRSHNGPVLCLQAYKNRLFSCSSDGRIKVWDLDDLVQGCKLSFVAHSQKVQSIAVNRTHLYSAGDDLAIKSWNLTDLNLHQCVEMAHEQPIAAMICSDAMVFSSSHKTIKGWNAITMAAVFTVENLNHIVRALALNSACDRLYSGAHGSVDIWQIDSDKLTLAGKISHSYGVVYSLAITEKYVIVGTYNQNIHIFDIVSQQYVQHFVGHVGIITSLAASPSGRFMFSASSDSTVVVWSLEKMLPIQSLQRHNDSANTMVVNRDLLLTGSDDSEIKVFKYFRMQMGMVTTT